MKIKEIEQLLVLGSIEKVCAFTEEEKALLCASLENAVQNAVSALDEEDEDGPKSRSFEEYEESLLDAMKASQEYISPIQYYRELKAYNWCVRLEEKNPHMVPGALRQPFVHKKTIPIAEARERQLIDAINPIYFSRYCNASLQQEYDFHPLNIARAFFIGDKISVFRHDMENYYTHARRRIKTYVADAVLRNYDRLRTDFFLKALEGKQLRISAYIKSRYT